MDGIINIYKESGYTSHDVVAKLRGILKTKKIGHTGTLDPMAEGVLPVCVGAATKLSEMFSDHDKVYEAGMILGKSYDTLDITGFITEEREVMSTKEDIMKAASSFVGGYEQTPPMYSAKKIDGKKLYDLARRGEIVARKPVFVNIYSIDVLSVDIPHVRILVHCGKGTYIRSLIDDLGSYLGCGAAMESLIRTRVGDFTVDNSYRLSDVEKAVKTDKISDVIIPLEAVFKSLDSFSAGPEMSRYVRNGNVLDGKSVRAALGLESKPDEGYRIRVYDCGGKFTGVYEYKISSDIFKPYKVFLS
ncbi:MAG: tRNA pseudouridine(55) synthase TruB [Lachnospiraceae bacterium]|nr:tRNA pseudouridine(55) synthase TruB [Lachnospiraceae bacterium]